MFIAPSFLNKNDFEFMDALIDMFKVTRTRAVEDDLNKYDSICLFDLFIDLRKDGMICSYYEDVYRKCHIEICRILNKIGYVNANSQQSKGKSHEIPQLIKVMIYYMSYRYIELYESWRENLHRKRYWTFWRRN
jgi:DNA-binding GntR family transcriptional regulator